MRLRDVLGMLYSIRLNSSLMAQSVANGILEGMMLE